MKLKIRDGFIRNESGRVIGTLTGEITDEEIRAIELGSEAIPIIEEFIDAVNSGKFTPKSSVRKFEAVLEKHEI